MLESELIRSINAGRCFVLIGSGPSCELGYPSWGQLAKDVRRHVLSACAGADADTYDKFLTKSQYPEMLREAERDLGSRDHLIRLLKTLLIPQSGMTSETYRILARWPFPVYLTTNFDDAISEHLESVGVHYTTLRSSPAEARQVRSDSSHIVFKLHGDLEDGQQAVVTSVDYTSMRTGSEREYIRQKLTAVFSMCDVFIIGHSLTDPDLQLILETAKLSASPDHPIYMALANITSGDIRELNEKYNIRAIPYKDSDNRHTLLKQMLRGANHFVCPRTAMPTPVTPVDEAQIEAATSLLLYRQTQAAVLSGAAKDTFAPLVLRSCLHAARPVTIEELIACRPLALVCAQRDCSAQVAEAIELLVSIGKLRQAQNGVIELTEEGTDAATALATDRELSRDQALGQFVLDLRTDVPDISAQQQSVARDALEKVLVDTYAARGLELANMVIGLQVLQPGRLTELFSAVTEAARTLESAEVRAGFIDVAGRLLLEPTVTQRKYLAALSQGFFLYHMAGLDPTCARLRREFLNRTAWFLDSSVFMPLLAWGCHNHEYAVDFLRRLTNCGTANFTTEKILREAWQHLVWAMRFIRDHGDDAEELLTYATAKAGYKQNLFVDGYIRASADGQVGSFADYLERAFPDGDTSLSAVTRVCTKYGVNTLTLDSLEGFEQNDWGDVPTYRKQLRLEREERGTYRGFHQVNAEAEILVIIRNVRNGKYTLPVSDVDLRTVYFVSQSRILDAVKAGADITTWSPEAVYRYLYTLPGMKVDADLLQECMLGEFFSVGAQVIDQSRYLAFFGPAISQARLSFDEQKEKYLASTETFRSVLELEHAFARTPDLEKPFFVTQMAWNTARVAEQTAHRANQSRKQAQERATAAESRAEKAEEDKLAAEKAKRRAESEVGRLRNLNDPNHLRKRERQAKKRRRRKKKGK